MFNKKKKSFTKAGKFEQIEQDRKDRLRERGVQKRTGYERDVRTMMKRILRQVTAAEEGEGEITRDELLNTRKQLDKLITKIRTLTGNKGVDLTRIRLRVETRKAVILDYISGKRKLAGKVDEHGQSPSAGKQVDLSDNGVRSGGDSSKFTSTTDEHGFGSVDKTRQSSREAYYKTLGFGDDEDENIANPVPQKKAASPSPIIKHTPDAIEQDEQLKKMGLVLIDSKISKIINDGIEHLMHYRRHRGADAPSYAVEIKRFIDEEIEFEKRKAVIDMKNRGYNEAQLQNFAMVFDREIDTNKNWMVRKCLYMSRVLEYRKGSTASG